MNVYFHPDYNATSYAFETTRKATQIAESLTQRPIPGVEICTPRPVTTDELTAIHAEDYVHAVRTGTPASLARSAGLEWDNLLFTSVAASNGGARDAALDALSSGGMAGSLSSGLHHAHRTHGSGFCTFNGLVIAALAARGAGARRILILDLDAHCGGGTAELISGIDGIEQLDISTNGFDSYPTRPDARLVMTDGADYLGVITRELEQIADPTGIDLVLYNAGMDPHHGSGGPQAITTEILAARERLVTQWATSHRCPLAWVLAGGYTWGGLTMDDLVDLHRLTLTATATSTSWATQNTPIGAS